MDLFNHHVISAIKNFLVVSTGAIIAYKIVNQIYDFDFYLYIFLGLGGFIILSIFEEEKRNGKSYSRRKKT
jgi:hypothetical protein